MIGNNSDRNKNKSDSERNSGSSSEKDSGSQSGQGQSGNRGNSGNSGTSSERGSSPSQDINSPSGNIRDMDTTTSESISDGMQEEQAVDSDDYLGIGDAIGEEDRGLLETSGDMSR